MLAELAVEEDEDDDDCVGAVDVDPVLVSGMARNAMLAFSRTAAWNLN